jgi:hypothetical protein
VQLQVPKPIKAAAHFRDQLMLVHEAFIFCLQGYSSSSSEEWFITRQVRAMLCVAPVPCLAATNHAVEIVNSTLGVNVRVASGLQWGVLLFTNLQLLQLPPN